MKTIFFFSIVFSLMLNAGFAQPIPVDSLYLGQTPPGNTPKIFKLPVDSGLMASDKIAITNDGKKIYYREKDYTYPPKIERTKYLSYDNNSWTGPFDLFKGFGSSALSITEDTMFIGESYAKQDNKQYFSVKNNTGWDNPKLFSSKLSLVYYLQETNNGNYYFASSLAIGGLGNSDWSKLIINGTDTTIQSLGVPLCTSGGDGDFSITRDESFMIFARKDIGISFHKNDGSWTNPKSLGSKVNFGLGSWGPYISPDNKYLFYTTGTKLDYSDTYIYWVRIDGMIDSLKKTNFIPYLKNRINAQTATVGHSFSYTTPDDTFIDDDGNNTLTYAATLSDGNPLPLWLHFETKTRKFSGTPTNAGNIEIKITATDTEKASVSCTFTINIKK